MGGDYKGSNAAVANARETYLDAQATLRADATVQGNGGKIILWSEEVTRAHGQISAQGSGSGATGGFVETSSHGELEITQAPVVVRPPPRIRNAISESKTVTRSSVTSTCSLRLNAAMFGMRPLRKPHAVVSRTVNVARGSLPLALVSIAFSPGTVPAGNPFCCRMNATVSSFSLSLTSVLPMLGIVSRIL